jgi:polyhydroxyalkanoate synthesis regulator phasin
MEQAGVEGDALHFVLISVDAALREGKISVEEAAVLFDELGLSTKEAQQRANAFGVESTRSFNKAGKAIRNFAGLTGGELKEWRTSTVESLKGTFGTISELGNRFDLSSEQLVKGVDKSRRQTERFAKDLEKLAKLDIADSIKKALLDEGPAAVDAFVRANDEGRRDIVADLKDQQAAFNDVKNLIDEIAGKIDDIGKKKAKAEVEIHYSVSGVPPESLPGFSGKAA